MRLLLDKGGLYKIYNGNLLFHGCIPLNEDGSLKEIQIYGKKYKGRELYDVLETYVRRAFLQSIVLSSEKVWISSGLSGQVRPLHYLARIR